MLKRCMKRHFKKLNNNGSTMLIVLVAVTLISLLATVLMAMSYMNYSMKATELESKRNFYTAEIVLDQINVGLQSEISASVEDAYIRSMQRYTLEDDEERNNNFANYYIGELRTRLRTEDLDSKYQIEPEDRDGDGVIDSGLVKYLDVSLQTAYTNGSLKITSPTNARMESMATATVDETGATVYESQGLVLYDLCIEYTDANDFTTIIETDIRLKTPSLTLVTKTAMPNVFDYSLVADAGIVGSGGSTVSFIGNVYAGNDVDPAVVDDKGGVNMSQGSSWTVDGESRLVSAGPLTIPTTSTFTSTAKTNCWFEDINLEKYSTTSGTLNLSGSTYVADDLTIAGKGANVTISGNYYGFGTETATAEGSSAIIVNGTNAIVDLSGLENLMLGGNAFIQTSSATYSVTGAFGADNNQDVLLGNSLAVKSDQIAYLVPADCVGVNGTDVLIGSNPMTENQYIKWEEYRQKRLANDASYANYEPVSFTKNVKILGKSLNEYEKNGLGYKTVFRQVNGQSLCYLYLDFQPESAAAYYKDYYYAAQLQMNQYIKTYNNRILMNPDMVSYEARGTVLAYALDSTGGQISIMNDTMGATRTEEEKNEIKEEQAELAERFQRLNAKLTLEESDVTTEELTHTVYENLINEAVMNALPLGVPKRYEFDVSASQTVKAVFINNRGAADYVYEATDSDVCVIVATGNVELKGNYEGVIICDGKIIVNGGVACVQPDKANVIKMLRTPESDAADATSLIATYFKDGDKYSMDTSLSAEVNNSMAGQEISDLVVYENWEKR